MSHPTLIPEPREAEQVERFVELTKDISLETLSQTALDDLPGRDCTYVWRLLILAEEDPELLSRQRIVWTKLRHEIPLLESEARELVEVLGCLGFYDVSLDLSGMSFGNLLLRGAVIGGNYRCRFTSVRGECDETALLVGGTATVGARRIEGVARGPWAASVEPPEPSASGNARFGADQQLSLLEVTKPEAWPVQTLELPLGALVAPRVPTRVSNELLASLPPMVELADDDIIDYVESSLPQDPAPTRARRAPARQPRTGARPATRASRPPDLRPSPVNLSDPRLLPKLGEGHWQSRLLDASTLLEGPLSRPTAGHSLVADTGEIDADW